ncbi:MAG: hypothetical protein HC803_07995 [Saprospiraceae bacterium]|nr:hypothetical protein [Saprospiraceae bacterium]
MSLKNRYETITETEQEELLSISTQIEMNDLIRILLLDIFHYRKDPTGEVSIMLEIWQENSPQK